MMPRNLPLAASWVLSCVFVWFGGVPRGTAADTGPIAAEVAGMVANWNLVPVAAGGTPVLADPSSATFNLSGISGATFTDRPFCSSAPVTVRLVLSMVPGIMTIRSTNS
jgi:hypothetical protein